MRKRRAPRVVDDEALQLDWDGTPWVACQWARRGMPCDCLACVSRRAREQVEVSDASEDNRTRICPR